MQNFYDPNGIVRPDEGDRKVKPTAIKPPSKPLLSHIGRTRTKVTLKDHEKDAQLIKTGLRRLASNISQSSRIPSTISRTNHHEARKVEVDKVIATPRVSVEKPVEAEVTAKEVEKPKVEKTFADKETMTDIPLTGTPLGLLEKTLLYDEPYISGDSIKDLQWTDPRLLKKYAMVTRFKKSLTIPMVKDEEEENELLSECSSVDDYEDEEPSTEIICDSSENLLLKSMYYMCTASVTFIGSMCGIILITMILWRILDDNIINFSLWNADRQFRLRFFPNEVRKLSGSLFQAWARILRRALTVTARDALAQENEGWFGMLT